MQTPEYTKESFLQAYGELLKATTACGFPQEVGKLLAKNLRSEKSIRRMISYMRNAHPHDMEQVADEMIAIMQEREKWILKKQTEESNSRYNAWLCSDERNCDD